MSVGRKIILTLLVVALSYLWRSELWLSLLTVAIVGLSIWWRPARRLVWLAGAVIAGLLIILFLIRPGGASNYTNWAMSTLLTLSLAGAVVELGSTKQDEDAS